jgi:diguanylate cyclase (GGDEF)-like protein
MVGFPRPSLPRLALPLACGAVAMLSAGAALGGAAQAGLLLGLAAIAAVAGLLLAIEARHALSRELLRDGLTGLPNHAGLRERLEEMLALSRRQRWQLGLLVLDLRNFREINEVHGRAAGDRALKLAAARLRAAVRREDMVARLGGDRFAVVQTALRDAAGVLRLAERLAASLAEPLPIEGAAPGLGADIGIAIAPEDGANAGTLLAHAEEALAVARLAPLPGIRCFAPTQDATLRERRELERQLREAVAQNRLLLHWQPQRRLSDGQLLGFEALLRWPHPTRGMIPPATFIPIAEATGLIVPLGAWVIRAAVAEASGWPGGLTAAVNLSAAQLRADGLIETVRDALAASGLPAHRLELEITESMLIHESQHCSKVLDGLRALGVSIALDDFGTGWSSLAYLRQLPVDQIKMDRGFLNEHGADPRGDAVVGAILGLGRGLGIPVIAEGVETEDQARRLAELGCERGQGWLLGRPMPAERARALIEAELRPAEHPAAA